jgi:uncharacterized lipoprotein YbaY
VTVPPGLSIAMTDWEQADTPEEVLAQGRLSEITATFTAACRI